MNTGRRFLELRAVRHTLQLLRQGTSPRKMAVSIALGFVLGIIPAFGFITPLCTALALWFRLNLPLLLSVLYLVLPLQLALFLPFLRLGERIFNLPPIPFSAERLLHMVQTDWWHTISLIGLTNLAGVAVWLIMALPGSYLLYLMLVWILGKVKKQQS